MHPPVGYVGGRQVDHEEPPIGIHRDVAFPPDDLLAGVVAALFRVGRLHRLAVDEAAGRARFSSASFPVDHQRDVVDRPEQKLADEAAEPPVNGLPPRKVMWQHPPPAPGSAEVSDGVENLPKIDHTSSTCLSRLRQQGDDQRPLFVRQIGRIASRLLRDLGHAAAAGWAPHTLRESYSQLHANPFSNGF